MHRIMVALAFFLVTPPALAEPRIIDSLGAAETEARSVTIPGSPVRWVPEVTFFVEFDGWAQEDVVLVAWRDGNKLLGKPLACASNYFQKDLQDNPTTPLVAANVAYFRCRFDNEFGITGAGSFQLGLTYKQTLAGTTHELGILTMRVIEIAQGSQNKPTATFADDRDHQLGVTTIEEYLGGPTGPEEILRASLRLHHKIRDVPNEIVIRFWTKLDDKGPRTMTMACLYGDKKVAEASNVSRGGKSSYWTFKGKERLQVSYEQQGFRFSGMHSGKASGPNPGGAHFLGDNPGEYRCVAMAGGEIVMEAFFTVNAAGEIQETACDGQARVLRHVHIIASKARAIANVDFDAAAGKKSGYFGRVVWKDACP